MSTIPPITNVYPSAPNPASFNLQLREMQADAFFHLFKHAEEIATDEIAVIQQAGSGIASIEMDDCITLFAVEKTAIGAISAIIGYHISSHTNVEAIQEMFDDEHDISPNLSYDIYLIGGNDASTAPGDLIDTIRSAIPIIFIQNRIVGEYLNLKNSKENSYISAGMTMDGVFVFCEHDSLE